RAILMRSLRPLLLLLVVLGVACHPGGVSGTGAQCDQSHPCRALYVCVANRCEPSQISLLFDGGEGGSIDSGAGAGGAAGMDAAPEGGDDGGSGALSTDAAPEAGEVASPPRRCRSSDPFGAPIPVPGLDEALEYLPRL